MSLLLRIGIILLFCQAVFAQQHYYQQFTVADGLPHTETTSVFIDKKGYVWAGCTNGWISRYDGLAFTNFSPEEIGMAHFAYKFFEDSFGLWAWDQKNRLSLFQHEKWMSIEVPNSLVSLNHYPKWGILGLDKTGKLLRYSHESKKWTFLNQLQIAGLHQGKMTNISFLGTTNKIIVFLYFSNQEAEHWELANPESGFAQLILTRRGGNILLTGNGFIYLRDELGNIWFEKEGTSRKNVIRKPSFFQVIGYEPDRGIWIQASISQDKRDKKIYWLDDQGNLTEKAIIERPVVNITVDRLGHFWLSSQGGLLKLFPWEKTFFEDQRGMIPHLHCIAEDGTGNVWMGGYQDGLVYYDGNQILPYKTTGMDLRLLTGSYCASNGGLFFWTENRGLIFIDGKKKLQTVPLLNPILKRPMSGYYFLPLSNGMLGLGTSRMGIGLLPPPYVSGENCRFISKEKGMLLDNVLCLEEDLKGRIWCGRTSQGMALYDMATDTARTWLISQYPDPGLSAMSMELDGRGNLWIGTNKGLYFLEDPHEFNPFSDSLFGLLKPVAIPEAGRSVVVAIKAHQDWLIFSNNLGHGFIDLKSFYKDPDKPRVLFTNTTKPERGGSGEQNALLIDKAQRIWIGKDRGAVCIDFKSLPKSQEMIKMAEPKLSAGGSPLVMSKSTIILPQNRRSLKIVLQPDFVGSSDRKIYYRYRLSGEGIPNPAFTELELKPDISFDFLPIGKYRLEIETYRDNQLADSRTLKIHVPGTLAERPAFWFAAAFSFFLVVGMVYHFKRRAELLQKKAELDLANWNNKLQETQVRAITSSLNPHFINNSLNWLQYKVIGDPQAVAVVERLSENIRTIFQHSRESKAHHTLQEELRLVENYLFIQKARYGQEINITLPDLDERSEIAKIHVPLMQLLIHVENAIEHGLRNRKAANTLEVGAELDGDFLRLTIQDDGAGRLKAKKMKSHGTQEGTKMLKEMHRIFNQKNKLKIKTTYEDTPFKDPNTGEGCGTIVHILIPIAYNYGFSES